ncbi:MAG: hypothetical protein Q8K36_04645, partial [Alphaproteobacteria bacterium]|nr:hypothetical protein [Alphaproteobacteria bacterium]
MNAIFAAEMNTSLAAPESTAPVAAVETSLQDLAATKRNKEFSDATEDFKRTLESIFTTHEALKPKLDLLLSNVAHDSIEHLNNAMCIMSASDISKDNLFRFLEYFMQMEAQDLNQEFLKTLRIFVSQTNIPDDFDL